MITPPPLSKYGTSKEFVAKKERERERSVKQYKKCFINQVAQATKWREMTKSKYRRKKLQIMIK